MSTETSPGRIRSLIDFWLGVRTEDPDIQRRGKSLHIWNGVTIFGLLVGFIASTLQGNLDQQLLIVLGVGSAAFLFIGFLTWRGRVNLAAWLLLGTWLVTIGAVSFLRGPFSPMILFCTIPIVAAGTTLSPISGLVIGVVFGAYYLALVALDQSGYNFGNTISGQELQNQTTVIYPALMVVTGVVVWLLAHSLNRAFRERQSYAQELEQSQTILEERVQKRTRELREANQQLTAHAQQIQASTEIGQAATQLLNLDQLLPQAAQLVQQQFQYYQVSIFLSSEDGRWANIRSASGVAGDQIVDEAFRLEVGAGSVVGQAMGNRKPYIVPDASTDSYFLPHPLLPNTRSEVALPLIVGEKLLGALDVQSESPDAFSDQSMALLQIIANQLAVAIDNAHKFQDEASVLAESSAFYRYSRAISLATDVAQVGKALMEYTASTPVDVSRLLLIEQDPNTKHSWIVLTHEWANGERPSQPLGTRLLLGDFPLGRFISEREAITIEDVQTDPSVDEATLMTLKIDGVRSVAFIPLHSGDNWLGTWFIGRNQPSVFEPRLIRSYQSLAQQAAVVMDNIRLLETTQHQARRERIISTVATELRSKILTEQVLTSAVQQLGVQIGARRAAIRLFTEPGDSNGKELPKA